MADPTEHDDNAELIACIRFLLGLRPLKPEPIGLTVFRFSLDGVRKQSRDEWAAELGMTRQAVDQRYEALQRRLAAGVPNAYELAMARRQSMTKRQRGKRAQQRSAA